MTSSPALASFAPGQPPDTTLLVPIDVLALAVGTAGGQAVPTETVLAPPASAGAPPPPPQPPAPFATPGPRARGIHVHWAMPDGLTRGDAGTVREGPLPAGNPTGLRPLPDRWLVVRMPHRTEACQGFLVEADRQRHADLQGWAEQPPLPAGTVRTPEGRLYLPGRKLTAVGGGDVAWAATYDAVFDRFGFFDPLPLAPQTSVLSYLVVGWWSDPLLDPLNGLTRLTLYHRKLTALGWSGPDPVLIPPATLPRSPNRTLLHGLVAGVPLSGAGTDARPDAAAVELGLGGTGFAAMAAHLADGTGEERAAAERVLAAFASGLLDRVDEPDGLVAIDEERHGSAFVAVSGGTSATPDRIAEGNPFETPAPAPAPAPAAGALPPAPRATLRRRHEHDVLQAARAALAEPAAPGSVVFRDVPTARPRWFVPSDLAIALHGARRSLRHGEDNELTFDGLVPCRLSHDLVTVAGGVLREAQLPQGLRVLPSTAIPVECQWLLREAVLADPFRAAQRRFWAGGVEATTPHMNPFWLNRWSQPWVPLWVDWELGVRVDADLDRWRLGPVELEAVGTPDGPAELVVRGRALLHASAGRAFGAQIRAWLDEERRRDEAGQGQASPADEAALMDAAGTAEGRDLLTGSLLGVRETLIGLDPRQAVVTVVNADGTPRELPPVRGLPRLLAGGAATVRRLRVVDAFGRWLDLPDTSLGAMRVATTHLHPAGAPRLTLAPRLQRPARVALRFVDPGTADGAAPREAVVNQEHPELAVSPIAGWLLPDHVDEALECFDALGRPLGQLMHDPLTGAVVFEEAPGRPGSIGGPPASPDSAARHVTRFAAGLVAADAAARNAPSGPPDESALSALLRGIDTTLWTVDPLGSMGTGAVAGLVGRPIAVVRALVALEVLPDLDELAYPRPFRRADRARRYAELAARPVALRLGELTRTDDGLLAAYVDDDYLHVRLTAREAADLARTSLRQTLRRAALAAAPPPPSILPVGHPYVEQDPELHVRTARAVRLTLLMNPGGSVHVTSGLLPRKGLALARDWFHEALERLSPSFRVGPVLVDPAAVRMPRVTGLGEHQTFTRRDTPLTWRDDPILASSQAALLPDDPAGLQEGWIRVVPETGGTS